MDIDEYVQGAVAGTCGNLYRGVVGNLNRYPIPLFPASGCGELLDVGCGWGRWTFAGERAGYHATGLDVDANTIAAATRVAEQIDSGARFVRGTAHELPFEDESFDMVFSYSVLQHLPESRIPEVF